MKIIKTGHIKEIRFETTCPACGTIFSFNKSEGYFVDAGANGSWVDLVCPFSKCSKNVVINVSDLKKISE